MGHSTDFSCWSFKRKTFCHNIYCRFSICSALKVAARLEDHSGPFAASPLFKRFLILTGHSSKRPVGHPAIGHRCRFDVKNDFNFFYTHFEDISSKTIQFSFKTIQFSFKTIQLRKIAMRRNCLLSCCF